jgi:hypothetical protein
MPSDQVEPVYAYLRRHNLIERVMGRDNDPSRKTYANQLILESERLVGDLVRDEEYFTLRSAAEHSFASQHMWVTILQSDTSSRERWELERARELGYCYTRYFPDVLDGLPLYVETAFGFRVATAEDVPYLEFVLLLNGPWSELAIHDRPPSWASELLIKRSDLYLYQQFFQEISTFNDQARVDAARDLRRRALMQALAKQGKCRILRKHLRALIDALPEIRDVLEFTGDQAVHFAIDAFDRDDIDLYLEHGESGLWTQCDYSEQVRALKDFRGSRFAMAFHNGDFRALDETPWRGLCITQRDYDKLIEDARTLADTPMPLSTGIGSTKPNDAYLDPRNPNHSRKLAAAISAWQALASDPDMLAKRHPKTVALNWLRANAHSFGLLKPDGKVNEQGIEDIAKVVNWKPEGGAPKSTRVAF